MTVQQLIDFLSRRERDAIVYMLVDGEDIPVATAERDTGVFYDYRIVLRTESEED